MDDIKCNYLTIKLRIEFDEGPICFLGHALEEQHPGGTFIIKLQSTDSAKYLK